jgi:hypothetical protein
MSAIYKPETQWGIFEIGTKVYLANMKTRDHLRGLGVGGRVIFDWIICS